MFNPTLSLHVSNNNLVTGPIFLLAIALEFILVTGSVKSNEGKLIPDFFNKPIVIALGETKELSHSLKDQSIDIKITPYIQ